MKKSASISVLIFLLSLTCMEIKGQTPEFVLHPVDLNLPGINCVKVFDLDLDGDYDIIGGSEHTPYSTSVGLMWWRNDGGNPIQWTKFIIDNDFLHVMSVDVNDVNGDDFPDVVASSWENGKITWWKNSGNPEQGWESFEIMTGWTNPHDAEVYDIDGDGDADVIGVSSGNNRISIFYNQGGSGPAWEEDVVTSSFGGAKSVIVADLNNDSMPELVGAGDVCDDIAWWENLGGVPITWVKRFITTDFTGSSGLDAKDMNNDGQLDIIGSAWEGNEVSFWICNDIGANSWNKTIVTEELETAVGAIGSDFDLDGDMDIAAVGKIPGELVVYVNDNDSFTKEVLYPSFAGGSALSVFDLDQDGDEDIIAGAGVLKKLYWFENKTIQTPAGKDHSCTVKITVFPNPAEATIVVAIPAADHSIPHFRLFDPALKPFELIPVSEGSGKFRIDITRFPSGLYFLEIATDKKRYFTTISIERYK